MSLNYNNQTLNFADLHIHSRFSRACSKSLSVKTLSKWGKIKGLDLIGTGDISHEEWLTELKELLVETKKNSGLFTYDKFKFILTGEISLIYTQGHGRKVHLVYMAPSFKAVDKINQWLDTLGRRDYDGRPIFKVSCRDFTKKLKEIDERIEIIPAHIWTPHFGVLGSKSGFNSLAEAFGDQIHHINAIETGISSTPEMNLQIKELQKMTIVSFADSHSYWPWRLGREATIFSDLSSYESIINQIRKNTIIGTIEVNPAYGKYHYDGHRNCKYSCAPQEAIKQNNICPVCKKPLLLGVEHRIEELSVKGKKDTKLTFELLPLHEILSLHTGKGVATKTNWTIYNKLIEKFDNEYEIILNISKKDLLKVCDKNLAELILKNRKSKIKVKPGYDGEYGVAKL